MTRIRYALLALAAAAAACAPDTQTGQPQGMNGVPAELAAVASAAAPGIAITSGELNASGNQFEITGTLANGTEVEIDLVQTNGAWSAVEIQRDIPWSSVPGPARDAAGAAANPFEPVRVIESTQVEDGSIVYELFRPVPGGTRSGGPDLEVRWHAGRAEILP